MTRRKPLDPDLYAAVVDEAKARFAVWPSAYASGWVVKTYKARGGRYAGQGRKESTGLTKWFGESWVDLSRPTADGGYEPCGRKRSDAPFDAAHYPKCRPLKEALRMSPDEVTDAVRRKRRAEASAPGRGSRARAPKRVATYRENPLPPQAVESDLLDAIEHADVYGDQGWTLDDFDVRYVGPKSLSAIRQYEDWGGWIDTAPEDYADLSPEERLAQLEGFRGKKWAERAAHWYATGKVPPVVAIEAPIVSEDQLDWQLGDGRGRINFALAMGLRTLPVIEMRWKGARAPKRVATYRANPLADLPVVDTEEWDDGTVVEFVAVPFPYERKPLAHRDDPTARGPVPLSDLIATQRWVTKAGVMGAGDAPITVLQTTDGRRYIADGHHRAVAAWLRGDDTIPAVVRFVRE